MDQRDIDPSITARQGPTLAFARSQPIAHTAKGQHDRHEQGFQSEHPANVSQSNATFASSRRRRRSANVIFTATEDEIIFKQPGSIAKSINNNFDNNTSPPTISILRKMTPDRGRIMLTQSRIRKGTFLFQVTAHATICDTERRKVRCGNCLGEIKHRGTPAAGSGGERRERPTTTGGGGGVACELCDEIWYCDQNCREQDWHIHQFECGYLSLLYKDNHTKHASREQWQAAAREFRSLDAYAQDYTRCLIRVLVHRFNELQATSPSSEIPSSPTADPSDPNFDEQDETPLPFSRIWDLVENRETYTDDKIEHEMKPVARILDAFQDHYCNRFSAPPTPVAGQESTPTGARLTLDELLGLVCREECNSFGLYSYPHAPWNNTSKISDKAVDNSKQGYALGLFARGFLSSFNHSCSPNVYHVAHKKYLLFYAACEISAGQELNISYLELGPRYRAPLPLSPQANQERLEAFKSRKAFLKSHFHFDCGCDRCRWEEKLQASRGGRGVVGMDQEQERFLSVGLICAREGCYGFYAPPTVLKVLLETEALDESQWICVACGHLQ
ncbi:hypothetical protein BGZ81_006135 [Podila clonocystis]|nr:hypothetical protein BGZ81_006135 [Podila clonocystis]